MKTKRVSFLILTSMLWLLSACGTPEVTFDQPQPVEVDALKSIPKRLQGSFLSLSDSSLLSITEKSIIRMYDIPTKEHRQQIEAAYEWKGDSLINSNTQQTIKTIIQGDSVIIFYPFSDTLFCLSDKNILKQYKGFYFMSLLYKANAWEVRKIDWTRRSLSISDINAEEEIQNLKEKLEVVQDTLSPYQYKASKKQFKALVKTGGFNDQETFVRLSNRN